MKIGIIAAMQIELDNLQKSMINVKKEEHSGVTYYLGNIEDAPDVEIIAAVCGVGKVFAAICAEAMINFYAPDMMINIGVAGAVSRELKVYDVVVAEKICQHDMNTTAVGDPIGLLSGINKVYLDTDEKMVKLMSECLSAEDVHYVSGTIATGDLFVETREQRDLIAERFGAVAADMESGSIGQVCYVNNVPFTILRSISDADGAVDYMTFAVKAAEVAINAVVAFIKKVNEL